MPHITIEHSADHAASVDWPVVLRELHRVTTAITGTDIRNCKSRVVRRDVYHVGDDDCEDGFVHVDMRLLEGRSIANKRELTEAVLATLRTALSAELDSVQVTVCVHDLDRAVYAKHPQGTLTPPERMR